MSWTWWRRRRSPSTAEAVSLPPRGTRDRTASDRTASDRTTGDRTEAPARRLTLVPGGVPALDPDRVGEPDQARAGAGPGPSGPVALGVLDGDETERARELCLRELDRAPRTRSELAAVLVRHEVAPDVAEAVLTRFTEAVLIDDAKFAEDWVASRHRNRGLATGQLRQELRRKGVEEEVVDRAVAELDPDDELETARQLIARKQRATLGLEPAVRMRRLAGVLARKGYPAGVAFQVVRDALAAEGGDPGLDLGTGPDD